MHWKELDNTKMRSLLESYMFLKKKRDDKIKGQTVDGGNKQRKYISKEEYTFTTVAT